MVSTVAISGSSEVEWSKTYGGQGYDIISQVIETTDGGYALVGLTGSFSESHDYWLVKTDQNGTLEWYKYYGGEGRNSSNSGTPGSIHIPRRQGRERRGYRQTR